ncbi:MAG TPA: proline--tRNA ligase, partial [Desulfobacteraceae bacterium]|nr:proline--tRNA ligase [Desulfobacteraceae bacterium]
SIGGSFSHEFMVLANTGEDQIVNCMKCSYAANLERAEVRVADEAPASESYQMEPIQEIHTPSMKTVEDVTSFLGISADQLIKTLIFVADDEVVAALVRGDHELNETKLKNVLGCQTVELAGHDLIEETTGAPVGFAGPVGLKVKVVADQSMKVMKDFVVGGNRKDFHIRSVYLNRDFKADLFGDLRVITPQDICPRCGGEIAFNRGIEVGHVFKLGEKYSRALKALYLDEQGRESTIIMGCYGIGVGRTVTAAIEQNHDKDGIIFPIPLAPFEVTVLPLQMHEQTVVESAEKIYRDLLENGIDVLLDDRDERAGVKFNDADLLGIPVRVNVGLRGLKNGKAELKIRGESETVEIPLENAAEIIVDKVKGLYDSLK